MRTGPHRKVVDGSLGPSHDPEAGSTTKKFGVWNGIFKFKVSVIKYWLAVLKSIVVLCVILCRRSEAPAPQGAKKGCDVAQNTFIKERHL